VSRPGSDHVHRPIALARTAAALAIAALVIAACGGGAGATGQPDIQVEQARAPQPASSVAEAFFTVRNVGTGSDTLLEVSTQVAAQAQVERVTRRGTRITMQPAGPLSIPAHGAVSLTPGGSHVMLLGLNTGLAAGNEFTLTLRFRRSPSMTIFVPVVAAPT